MHSIFIQIGGFSIRWFGVMMALGFLAAFVNLNYQAKLFKIDNQFISDMLVWILVGGILGARTAYVIANWHVEYADNPLAVLYIHRGGLIYYGGLIGGVISSWIYVCLLKKYPPLPVADIAGASLPLGQAFGRIGCFMNGCCYGRCTHSPIGVKFPVNSPAWIDQVHGHCIDTTSSCSLSVYPVQLFESIGALIIFGILWFALRKQKFAGVTASLYLILYGILRFCMEFFRGDERQHVGNLTTAQLISVLMICCGFILFAFAAWKHRKSV